MLLGSSKVRYLRILMREIQGPRMRRHSQILEYFSEPETFHVIDFGGIRVVNVVNTCIRNTCRQVLLKAFSSIGCSVQVLGITSHTPSIEVRLKHFRTKDVVWIGDVKAMLVVKSELLIVRGRAASVAAVAGHVCENFRTNARTGNDELAQGQIRWEKRTYAVLAYVFQHASVS
jgi:hypothetical protein